MKLWLLEYPDCRGYDCYDSAVVAAETEEEARDIHPSTSRGYSRAVVWKGGLDFGDWARTRGGVNVKLLGEAAEGIEAGVVCASFIAEG